MIKTSALKIQLWKYIKQNFDHVLNFEIPLPGNKYRADVISLNPLTNSVYLFELKISKEDFVKGLDNMEAYYPYANECFLVIPLELLEKVEAPVNWGIIVYSTTQGFSIVRNAIYKPIPHAFYDFYVKELLTKFTYHLLNFSKPT